MRPCVIIPAYDAGASVAAVVDGAAQELHRLAADGTVFVVDDGSHDDTADQAAGRGARVVRHTVNQGKGAALLTGFAVAQEAGFTHAVTVDADGQHRCDDLAALLEASEQRPAALIVGVRDFSAPNVPRASRIGRSFSNFWVRLETRLPLADTQSGLRVYPLAEMAALDCPPGRFEWEVEVIVRAAWAGVSVLDVPVSVFYPRPEDRVSHFRPWVDSARISALHLRLLGQLALRHLRQRSSENETRRR